MAMRFLLSQCGDNCYLIAEEDIEKVLSVPAKDIFESPYGPSYLKGLAYFDKEFIPFITLGEEKEWQKEGEFLAVVIKHLISYIAVKVDKIFGFVEFEMDFVEGGLAVDKPFVKKALDYNGRECYLLDSEALFNVRSRK